MSDSRFNAVIAAIRSYESQYYDSQAPTTTIAELCGESVERYALDNYWRSESLETFAARLAIDAIADWTDIDDSRAVSLISEVLSDPCNDPVIDRNCEALSKRYRKTRGQVTDQFFQNNFTAEQILAELKQDTTIYL